VNARDSTILCTADFIIFKDIILLLRGYIDTRNEWFSGNSVHIYGRDSLFLLGFFIYFFRLGVSMLEQLEGAGIAI
jgi:hypothetical protein